MEITMLIATIVLVSLTGLGMAGAFLKAVFHYGKKSGELTSALNENKTATQQNTHSLDKVNDTISDHEIRITRLEIK